MRNEPWICPGCGLEAPARPDILPSAEVSDRSLATWHQWARHFEHLNHDAWAEEHPEPAPTALDFVHWVQSCMATSSTHAPSRRGSRVGRLPRLETIAS